MNNLFLLREHLLLFLIMPLYLISQPANLIVEGNIDLVEDFDIKGVDEIVGHNDLTLSADPNGGPDLRIGSPGYTGIGGALFSNVALNIRNIPNNTAGQILNVELNDGTNIFQLQADQDCFVIGDFFVNNGTKNFIIDHPMDPANLSLVHNAMEAPGYFTYYHGTAVIGPDSSASVVLPEYFQALNTDYHYQLTCIGGYSQVYISKEITENQFQIAGGFPGLKVSWQISAERNDPWARNHPYETTLKKEGTETGRYWYPEGYGYSNTHMIGSDAQYEVRKGHE